MNTFDPEIHVSFNLFTPKTSSTINIQAIISSSHASSFKKKKTKSSRSKFFKVLSSMSFQFIEYFNNLFYTSDQDFDAEFREFLNAITATSIESLSEIQIITKRNDFHRMNRLLKTFLIDVERSEFSRISIKDVLNYVFFTYISLYTLLMIMTSIKSISPLRVS